MIKTIINAFWDWFTCHMASSCNCSLWDWIKDRGRGQNGNLGYIMPKHIDCINFDYCNEEDCEDCNEYLTEVTAEQ